MKKTFLEICFMLVVGVAAFSGLTAAQVNPPPEETSTITQDNIEKGLQYCPNCGCCFGPSCGWRMGMGRGMKMRGGINSRGCGDQMMGRGYGKQCRMMRRGWGQCPEYGPQYLMISKPLTEKEAKTILENYLTSTRNPNLTLGRILEKDTCFEIEILTRDNSLVDKMLLDKSSGWMQSVY